MEGIGGFGFHWTVEWIGVLLTWEEISIWSRAGAAGCWLLDCGYSISGYPIMASRAVLI
jgi:hypothetical protein